MIYVLFILAEVYGGISITTQEFRNKEACETAIRQISPSINRIGARRAEVRCISKETGEGSE